MLNELAKEIHENAVAHGWWDEPRSFGEVDALCHSELSEALEEHRDGRPMLWFRCPDDWNACDEDSQDICESYDGNDCTLFRGQRKPEGVAVEMADCIIRILDWCGKEGIDIDKIIRLKMEYNKTRPYRHGGKLL